MPRDRKTDIHIAIPDNMLNSIDEEVEMGEYRNRTHAILYYIRVGKKINEFKIKFSNAPTIPQTKTIDLLI